VFSVISVVCYHTRHLKLTTQIPQKLTKLFFTILQHEIPQAATNV